MSEFMRQFCLIILFLKFNYMLEIKNIGQKLQKKLCRKSWNNSKKGIQNFSNHAFQRKFGRAGASNSEELEQTICTRNMGALISQLQFARERQEKKSCPYYWSKKAEQSIVQRLKLPNSDFLVSSFKICISCYFKNRVVFIP